MAGWALRPAKEGNVDRTVARIGWLLLVVGIGLLGGAAYVASRTAAFLRSAEQVEGTVVALVGSDTYAPRVEYRLPSGETRTFTSGVRTSPPAYDVGERVTVSYDPQRPGAVRLHGTFSLWGFPIFLGGFGLVLGGAGGVMLAVRAARRRREAALRLHGRRVQARFQAVERNASLTVNGVHPWRIVCQWQDPTTGLLHVFKSRNLWFDPTSYVRAQELTVFVDPRNPRRYAVDVEFLPRLAA